MVFDMYECPVKFNFGDIQMQIVKQQENEVYMAVQKCGVDVDKEELKKALKYDREQYEKGYEDGCRNSIVRFASFLKDNSFLCDSNDWFSFQAINVEDDLDDLVEEFLNEELL